MKKTNFKSILFLSLLLVSLGINAQNSLLDWDQSALSETENMEKAYRNTSPQEFQVYSLNTSALRNAVAEAPIRFSGNSNVIIDLPTNNGVLQSFRVYEASNFAPELQERHPNIRSYMAQGIDDASAIARFSISDNDGFHAMITSVNYKTVYIDPFTTDNNYYIRYDRDSLEPDSRSFECMVQERLEPSISMVPENADDGMLRTFRLALACTGEYAQWHLTNQGIPSGATDAVKKAAVLTAMNTAMTRVNGIYEKDLAAHMEIIANNEDIIYLIAGTDPYTNNNGFAMLGQNQSTCDSVIGSANYDIGHVFSTGGGGVAYLQSVCNNSNKAGGVTGLTSPIGDIFYVDYVSHEIGHQFGGNHTQNNNCNRNLATAMEPGSASTIMGYAGICAPNVQNNSDDYFHAISIQEMWNHISVGGGQCSVQTATGNSAPTADAGADVTIPKSTPFRLQGIATDPDGGNVLSHSWEQMNNQVGTMPPVNTSVLGPMFRSIDPLPDPERYMPQLSTVLTGQTQNTWEVVPSVARTMNFRYTVRDNVAGGASSASDDMVVTVDGTAGPFVVTSQMTATTWQTSSFETITWDVAGTDVAPVNSPLVDVLFSTDGGLTYPIVVANDIPNTGTASISVPAVNTTTGRFMIISSNNIFFDINGGVITIGGCSIAGISTSNVSACDDNGTPANPGDDFFTADVTITFLDSPSTGTLDLSGDGTASVSVTGLTSPHTFTDVQMTADGGSIDLTATFSDDTACTLNAPNAGTAPQSCSVGGCNIAGISTSNVSACDDNGTPANPGDDFFTADVTITFSNPTATGTLDLSGDGTASVSVTGLTSPHTFTAVQMTADGGTIDLTATFSDDTACTVNVPNAGTAPQSCSLVGLNEFEDALGISVYPNPADSEIMLLNVTQKYTVAIYNLLGQKVIEQEVDVDATSINISNLSIGTYLMKFEGYGEVLKIVKK